MSEFKAGDVVWVKPDWYDGGRIATVLGPTVFVEQDWTPVLFHDENDPSFFKTAGLELKPSPAGEKENSNG